MKFDLSSLDEGDYAEVRDPDKLMRTLGRPLSPKDIILGDRIGEGQFGDVHTGILYPDVSCVYLSPSPSIHLSLIHVSMYVSYICVGYRFCS